MAPKTVLQLVQNSSNLKRELELRFECYYLWEHKDQDAFLAKYGPSIRAVVASAANPARRSLFEKLPNLEIVANWSVGVDNIDVPFCKSKGIAVTNTPDVLTDCVAETAFALLFATMRKIIPADRFVRAGRWGVASGFPPTFGLSKKHVGIVGLGRIGAAIAKRVESFGGNISYWSRSSKPQFPAYKFYESVVDLAKECNILIVACALTEETTKLVNREVLDALGPQGFLVNIARGKVIDEAELVKVLVAKGIAGAGLDVYENEPIVPEELFSLDNVVLLPHLGSGTVETWEAMTDLVVANLEAQFTSQPLLTPVD